MGSGQLSAPPSGNQAPAALPAGMDPEDAISVVGSPPTMKLEQTPQDLTSLLTRTCGGDLTAWLHTEGAAASCQLSRPWTHGQTACNPLLASALPDLPRHGTPPSGSNKVTAAVGRPSMSAASWVIFGEVSQYSEGAGLWRHRREIEPRAM